MTLLALAALLSAAPAPTPALPRPATCEAPLGVSADVGYARLLRAHSIRAGSVEFPPSVAVDAGTRSLTVDPSREAVASSSLASVGGSLPYEAAVDTRFRPGDLAPSVRTTYTVAVTEAGQTVVRVTHDRSTAWGPSACAVAERLARTLTVPQR